MGPAGVRPAASSAWADRSANACGVRVTAYVAKYIWRTDAVVAADDLEQLAALAALRRPGTGRRASRSNRVSPSAPAPGEPGPQLVVAHLEDELLALGPPAAEQLGEAGLRLLGRPRPARAGSASSTAVTQLGRERDGLGAGRARCRRRRRRRRSAADPQAGEEARHRAAVPD